MSVIDPLLGQQFGNFVIQEPLGRGGMARVYKGIDLLLKRPVAIKMIEEGLRFNETYALRFEREAQAVANLKHPNIVTVFHYGKHDNYFYLVMEYLDGGTLDAIERNYENNGELMPHADVVRILEAIGSALDYAHAQGIIHRDVKPSNIILEKTGRPVLTDFGLALRVSEGTSGDTFGSPHYISPEQARNSASAVPQSDLYSLGVVAYELLVGVVPFDDPTPMALAMQHILAAVPSPCAFNRNLSEGVEQVLFKVLAKTPVERYQSSQEFVAALREALEALKRNPPKIQTADLPPLPAGVTAPPARRLSMQTALDKLDQELALAQAKGQAPTRQLLADESSVKTKATTDSALVEQRRRNIIPYVVTGGCATVALILAGLLFSHLLNSSAVASTLAVLPSLTVISLNTETNTATLLATPILETTAVAAIPTITLISTVMPVQTVLPSSITLTPTAISTLTVSPPAVVATGIATFTLGPSPSAIPPNSTTGPLSTLASTLPVTTQAITPTILYPNGLSLVFIWDNNAFYVANQSGQKISSGNLGFDQVLGNGQFSNHFAGERWQAFYAYSEPNKCLILNAQGKSWRVPASDCPYGYNSQISAFGNENFWISANGSTTFRVTWQGNEVGRCVISQLRCELRFPPG